MSECRCGKATRDDAYVCDGCSDELGKALGDVTWLAEELETSITRQRGIDYRGATGGSGAKKPSERPSPVSWGPADARAHLKALLVSWALFCAAEGVRTSDERRTLPEDDLVALSRWLLWRVDGLALHEIGAEAVDEITNAVAHCHRLIDRPVDRQYLGHCPGCNKGRLYATPGAKYARCDDCGVDSEADAIRTRLLDELDDRLCTAAEIARLATYLGLQANREQVRNRINQWHKRERISREAAFGEDPVFRFGIVWRLLMAEDQKKAG